MKGRVLIIAGSDPSGGAGIQADIKTVTALGGYAATAITAITVQNTTGVRAVHPVAPDVIAAQIDAVLSDIGADAIKLGMIGNTDAGHAILSALATIRQGAQGGYAGDTHPLIVDPVLAATSGHQLATPELVGFIRNNILPITYIVTPNVPEAEQLTDMRIRNVADQTRAGEMLLDLGAEAALVKGGHLSGETVDDVLVTHDGTQVFSNPRLDTTSTHGTGCTLASAIAVGLAQGIALPSTVKRAVDYVHQAIKTAPGFGAGCGPLNHGHVFSSRH